MLMQLLYFSSFLTPILAAFLYKCKRPAMLGFMRRMTLSYSFRKLYIHMVTLYLIAFLFYHLSVFNRPLCLLPSTVIAMLTFSFSFSERTLRFVQHSRTFIAFCLIGMLSIIIPDLLPLGFTLIVLAVAAMFYPSRFIMDDFSKVSLWQSLPDVAVDKYFRWEMDVDARTLNIIRRFDKSKIHPDAIEDAEYVDEE